MGLVPLEDETRQFAFSLGHVRTQKEGSHLQARRRALTKTQPFWHPDLRLLASRTVRKKRLLFKPWYFVMSAQAD